MVEYGSNGGCVEDDSSVVEGVGGEQRFIVSDATVRRGWEWDQLGS